MITTFRHKGLRELFEKGFSRRVSAGLAKRLTRQLDLLNRARDARDMDVPGYYLHELKGERAGVWSVRVSGNWRLTFRFENENAAEVDLEDYH